MKTRIRKIVSTDIPYLIEVFCSEKGEVRKPRTVDCVKQRLDHFVRWIAKAGYSIQPKNWTHDHALAYRKYLLQSGLLTAPELYQTAKYFFRWIQLRGFIKSNPFDGVMQPRKRKGRVREPISEEEFRSILGYVRNMKYGEQLHAVFVIGYYTGMSVGDASQLKWGEVDMDACVIRRDRNKTGVRSTIPFERGGELHSALEEMRDALPAHKDSLSSLKEWSQYVVPDLSNGDTMKAARAFAEARDSLGISKEKTFHNFRATMASRLINGGVSSIIASRITGHNTLSVFNKYVKVDEAVLEKAVRDAGYISNAPKIGQEIPV